jgi:hypothetical protein
MFSQLIAGNGVTYAHQLGANFFYQNLETSTTQVQV